jgi:hypothetical protein
MLMQACARITCVDPRALAGSFAGREFDPSSGRPPAWIPVARTASSTPSPGTAHVAHPVPILAGEVVTREVRLRGPAAGGLVKRHGFVAAALVALLAPGARSDTVPRRVRR